MSTHPFWGDTPEVVVSRSRRRAPRRGSPAQRTRRRSAIVGLATMALLLALAVTAGALPGAIQRPPGYNTNPAAGNPTVIPLPFAVNFYGTTHLAGAPAFMYGNGAVSLTGAMFAPGPGILPLNGQGADVIAPFLSNSAFTPGAQSWGTATADNGRPSLHMNWDGITHLPDGLPQRFQLVIVNRGDMAPGDFDMVFNYDSLPSVFSPEGPEQAGWGQAGGVLNEFPGSLFGVPPGPAGALHDAAGPFALSTSGNTSFPGRFYYTSRAGVVSADTSAPTDPTLSSMTPTGTPLATDTVTVNFAGATDGLGSGVDGFAISWTADATGLPPAMKTHEQNATSDMLMAPAGGTYYFNLRTVDSVGLWTNTVHLGPFVLDSDPPSDPTVLMSSTNTTGTWATDPSITVTWSADATDAVTGVDGFSYSWSQDTTGLPPAVKLLEETASQVTSSVPSDGWWWFNLRTVDNGGNWTSTVHLGPFGVDTVAPDDPTGISSSTDTTGTWETDASITVTWSADATDAASGVDGFSYSWSKDATGLPPAVKSLEETVTQVAGSVPSDGWWWFNLRTVDIAGNWTSTIHLGPFGVDTTPPVTTDDYSPPYVGSATISLTATDGPDGSGVDYTRWRLDGGMLTTGTVATTDTVGMHVLEYFSVDVAGNVEATQTLNFEVLPDPYAVDDAYAVDEDGLLVVSALGVLTNDLDGDGDPLTAWPGAVGPSNGTLLLSPSGAFIYTPDPDYFGVDVFTYYAHDGTDPSPEATVTITVNPVQDEPVISQGASEETTTSEDTTVSVALDATDADGDTLTWSVAVQPADGTAMASGTGTSTVVTYTPDPDYNGDDSFTVKVEDTAGNTDLIVVIVHVTPVNDPPVAMMDTYTTPEDTTLTVPAPGMLANDYDVDGDSLSLDFPVFIVQFGPWDSFASLGADGSFEYVPAADATGTTVFWYRASDGTTTSALTTWTVTVTDVNDAPTDIALSSASIDESLPAASVVGTLSATDVDSTSFTYTVGGADAASFAVVGNNLVTTEVFDFETKNSYSITLMVEDEGGLMYSEPAAITVANVNEPPVAMGDAYTTAEDTTLTVAIPGPPNELLANDYDPEMDFLIWAVWTNPTSGTLLPDSPFGEFRYVPDADFNGTDTFRYRTMELTPDAYFSEWVTVTITVTPVNDPPVPVDDAYSVDEDDVLFAGTSVLANDSDPVEGDALMAWLDTSPSSGNVVFNEPQGTFIYTPDPNYNGPDSFTYSCDDGSDTVTATVSITVNPVQDEPTITQGSSVSTSAPEDTTKTVGIDAVDLDGDPLTWYLASDPEHGEATLTAGPAGSTVVTYVPDPDYNGLDSFEVAVADGMGGTDVVLITIDVTPVNDSPVGVEDFFTVPEDTTLTVAAPGMLANDYDVDGDTLWWFPAIPPTNGTWLPIAPFGDFAYRGDPDWSGTDYFYYFAGEEPPGTTFSGLTTVTIVVTPVNDAPTDIALSNNDIDENMPAGSHVGTLTATDVDSSGFTYTLETTTAPFKITNDRLRTTMPLNFEMQPSWDITITVDDGAGGTYSELFTITVNDVNDPPVAWMDGYITSEDTTLVVAAPGFFANDSDEDSDTLTAMLGDGPYNGSLEASLTSGGITYTPDPDWFGIDTFTYAISDGTTKSATVTVSIQVVSVNDVPIGAEDAYAMDEDTMLEVDAPGVLDNDFDVEGPMSSVLETDVSYGDLALASDGSFTYESEPGWSGTDMFWYRVWDGETSSTPVTVTITVDSVDTKYIPVAGANRLRTAIQASKKAFPSGATTIVVATGYDWPDALGGSALAGMADGPVLLTKQDSLPSEVLNEVRRLGVSYAYVLGGQAAVSSDVFIALRDELGAGNVRRIGGTNRYETARLVADEVVALHAGAYDGMAFAATGEAFPDALAVSPLAAAKGWPIYLVRPATSAVSLRTAMQADGVTDLAVLGGEANVSLGAQATLGAGSITVSRISGSDRYATCAAVAEFGVAHASLGWDGVAIGTGENFPDALAGGVYAGKMGTVLLMTPTSMLHSQTAATLTAHRSEISTVSYLGGTVAIEQSVRDEITGLLR